MNGSAWVKYVHCSSSITTKASIYKKPLPLSTLHPILNHSIDKLHMPIRIRLGPLIIIVQSIRPDVSTSAVDLRIRPIPCPQQSRSTGPVVRRTPRVEAIGLTNTQRVRDLVHGGPLVHVRPVGSEAQVAVVVCLGGGDARGVGDTYRLGYRGVFGVAGGGEAHGVLDLGVGVALVGSRVGGFRKGPVDGGVGGGGGGHKGGGDEGELHGG